MREQLDALAELAKIDQGFRQLDVELDEQRARLAGLRDDVEKIRALLEREKRQLVETEAQRTQTLGEVEDLGERVGRTTARHNAARNSRERDASQRELEVLRRERDERGARGQELGNVLSQLRESIVRHEGDFAQLEKLLADEEVATEQRVAQLGERRVEHEAQRKSTVARVRADLLRKYELIRAKKGSAVAEIENGICRACHISLPPQVFAKMHAHREVLQCPSCQRLMVLKSAASGGAGAAMGAPAVAGVAGDEA